MDAGADLARLPFLWDAIHGREPAYLALLSGVRIEGRLLRSQERFFRFPTEVDRAVAWIRGEAGAGRELYHCGHLLREPRRRKEFAAPLACLYADIDHADVGRGVPEPTVLIESSPGRLQGYWRLTHSVAPARGEELNRRLAFTLGADPSGWDLTQLLRVPGTRNHKYTDAPPVRLLHVSRAYFDPEELARLLVPLPPRSAVPPRQRPRPDAVPIPAMTEPPVRLSPSARVVWEGRDIKRTPDGRVDRSASLVRIARVLFEAGLTPGQVASALAERDATLGWEKYTGRRDAAAQYASIVAAIIQGRRTRRRADR